MGFEFRGLVAYLLFLFLFPIFAFAADGQVANQPEFCMYKAEDGTIKQTSSRAELPEALRDSPSTKCFKKVKRTRKKKTPSFPSQGIDIKTLIHKITEQPSQTQTQQGNTFLANPEDIELKGTKRRESMASSLGRIELRWPRIVELLFGRNPKRAMADAARTVSRTLKQSGFPMTVRNLDLDWQVVFMDAELPETQIPAYLVSNCHPGWMTPPANIYIVSQRVVAGCGGAKPSKGVADSKLAELLMHEMGHVIEYALLKGYAPRNRVRSEGFATWFESYASDFSAAIKRGAVREMHFANAKAAINQSPNSFHFAGTAGDYARASLYFHVIVKKKGVRGLMEVYDLMSKERIPFFEAVDKRHHWSKKKLEKEVLKFVKKI